MNSFIKFNTYFKRVLLYSLFPLIYFIFAFLLVKTGSWPELAYFSFWQFVLITFLFLGFGIWFMGYFYLPPSARFFLRTEKLIICGPYRFFRHPIYIGAMMIFWSLSLLARSLPALWYASLVIFPILFGRAKWEEKILTKAFGNRYRKYKQRTLF